MESQIEYAVESIVKCRLDPESKMEYLIKWKGYDESQNSWEPIEYLEKTSMKLIKKFHRQKEKEQNGDRLRIRRLKRVLRFYKDAMDDKHYAEIKQHKSKSGEKRNHAYIKIKRLMVEAPELLCDALLERAKIVRPVKF